MKAFAGAVDQALSADTTTAECSTDALSNDTMTGEKKGKECVVFRLDHVVPGKSSGSHCKCTTRLGHGGEANAHSSVLSKEQCETCCTHTRSVGVSFGHKRCGEQSGDDGTDDQRVREICEHRNSRIL